MGDSAFGLFEAAAGSTGEAERQQRVAADKMAAALYDVKQRVGSFLFAATDVADFRDRVALCKDDMIKTVEPHLFPRTGTMRLVCKTLEREFKTAKGDTPLGGKPTPSEEGWRTSPNDGEPVDAEDAARSRKWLEDHRSKSARRRTAEDSVKAMDNDVTFSPDQGAPLIPEGDFHGYKDGLDQDGPAKVDSNAFSEGEHPQEHTGDPADTDFITVRESRRRSAAPGGAPLDLGKHSIGEEDNHIDNPVNPYTGGGLYDESENLAPIVAKFASWCRKNNQPATLKTLDKLGSRVSDDDYFAIVSAIQRKAESKYDEHAMRRDDVTPEDRINYLKHQYGLGHDEAVRMDNDWNHPGREANAHRIAAPDYLQKADEALTNLLNQRAEEFQEQIAPLQQSLQIVQQAEQAQQAANPFNVMPGGSINVMPPGPDGQPQGAPDGGDPSGGGMPMDPNMGGGDPSMGGGAPPMDPSMMGGGGMPPDQGQQMMARRRKADVISEYENWQKKLPEMGGLPTGSEADLDQFANERKVGPRALQKLKTHLTTGQNEGKAEARKAGTRRADRHSTDDFHTYNNQHITPEEHERNNRGYSDVGNGMVQDWETGEIYPHPKRKSASARKQAWMGWGADQPNFHHKVAGWEWDDHLDAHVASAPHKFACTCGSKFSTPTNYHRCKCGKAWNAYVIGTGGDRHEASADKYLVREVPVRDNVIVAGRKAEASFGDMPDHQIPGYLEHLRGKLRNEDISYGELSDLQGLAAAGHIHPQDGELLEAAGVPEEDFNRGANWNPETDPFDPRQFGASRHACAEDCGCDHPEETDREDGNDDGSHEKESSRDFAEAFAVAYTARESAIHDITKPGEIKDKDGEDDGRSTMKQQPDDWARRNPDGKWNKGPRRK
ncbi:hypothetical protein [Mycolicibacter kumamotonensis]|nr:hypothetical protein [Mycolicibacter kumamotonensis]